MIRVTRRKQQHGKRSDARAEAAIAAAGWTVTHRRPEHPRYVAVRSIREEDDSTTRLFESTVTIEGLSKLVTRRMREEGL